MNPRLGLLLAVALLVGVVQSGGVFLLDVTPIPVPSPGSGPGSSVSQAIAAVALSASRSVPEAYVGVWEGVGTQVSPHAEFPMTLSLSAGDVGADVGTTDYPSYGCGGTLTLKRVSAGTLYLHEQMQYGLDMCADGGVVILDVAPDGRLIFQWAGIHAFGVGLPSTATGTLSRAD